MGDLDDSGPGATHVAFGDESNYMQGRYRSVAVVAMTLATAASHTDQVAELLRDSDVREMKWVALRSARERHAALKLVRWTLQRVLERSLTVDALVWDTHDSRHRVLHRDDIANLHRMYFRLLSRALLRPGEATWRLHPDENGAMDWGTVRDVLQHDGRKLRGSNPDVFPSARLWRLARRWYHVQEIRPVDSRTTPLVQLADLFAGLAVYSRESYGVYDVWRDGRLGQNVLFGEPARDAVAMSVADRDRCEVLFEFNELCKKSKLGVSLRTHRGLETYPPGRGMNFWFYRPQHVADIAPTRSRGRGTI